MSIGHNLLKACLKNKRKAQEELYRACYQFLMPVCKRYYINEDDAHSAFNEVYLKILDNLGKVDWKKIPFNAWAKRVTINFLIDEYRKNKKYKEKVAKVDDERKLEFFAKEVKNNAEQNLAEKNILRLLDYLKPDTKRVFMLYVIEGYKHREISEIMEMSVGTSKWHLAEARKGLKKLIEQQEKINSNNLAI